MEIRVEWDDFAREYIADVVDYEGEGPTGSGGNKPDALFDLVQNLKHSDKARAFAIYAYGDELTAHNRFRVYASLRKIGCLKAEADAKADHYANGMRNGFAFAVELLA